MENINIDNFNKKDNSLVEKENGISEYWIVSTITLMIIIVPMFLFWYTGNNEVSRIKNEIKSYQFKNDSLNKEVAILKDSLESKLKVENTKVKKQSSNLKMKSYYDSKSYKNKKNIVKKVEKPKKKRKVKTHEETYSSGTCGAITRKGGYCKRTVKGGGRCWQH
jgi:di/tripeptidase